jgi:predicted dehydrogenase
MDNMHLRGVRPVRVALFGSGFGGKVFHAPLIRTTPGLELASILTSRSDPREAFDAPEIGLIVISTPNGTHFDLARQAIAAGKHVVVDKPFTLTVAEAEELAHLALRTGVLLSVFQNRRWDSDFLTLRQVIASGELGEIVHFESHYDRFRPVVVSRWKDDAGPGSGIWYDLGPHLADQALQLLGPPESVFADFAMQRDGAQAVDYFHVVLRYPNVRVVLHASTLVAEPPRRFELHGKRGSCVKHGMDIQEDLLKRGDLPGAPGWGTDPNAGVLTTWAGDERVQKSVPNLPGGYPRYYEAIRDAILKGAPNPVPPEDGIAVMRVIEAGIRSAAEGKLVGGV